MAGLLRQLGLRFGDSNAARQPRRPTPPPSRNSPSPLDVADRNGAIAEAAAHAKEGRLAESLKILSDRLAQDPDSIELIYQRGLTLLDWSRFVEALEDLRIAAAAGMSTFGLHLNLAQTSHALGFAAEAEEHARRAIALDPSVSAAHVGLGAVLQGAKRFDEAIQSYQRAYELAPDSVDCAMHIIACELDQQKEVSAEALAQLAISRHGDHAKLWGLLGIALTSQDRFDEATAAFERADELESRTGIDAGTFVKHGFQLFWAGELDKALDLYARRLPGNPSPSAHANYGLALLGAGLFREGWPLYEFRWCYDPLIRKPLYGIPEWHGQDLRGKKLLFWAEQGAGDAVQFVRFARTLAAKGARVALRVPETLRSFAETFPDIDHVVAETGVLASSFDYHISLMSVARVLGIDPASVPAEVPYLTIDAERKRRWRERFAGGSNLKVGLVWAGNPKHKRDRFRSMSLSALKPLLLTEGVEFFSLQKDRRADDSMAGVPLVDLGPDLEDFRDTAAAVDALDLVICVDTAVAHIAGALAKPVWVMLAAAPDFRWLTARRDSPWYPTMRLFRQRRLGEWEEVLSDIREALCDLVTARKAGEPSGAARSQPESGLAASAHSGVRPHRVPVSQLCRVADTRHGLVQYTPGHQPIGKSLDWYGEWLQHELELLAKLLRQGATVLEAGGGVGAHTLPIARMLGPNGHLLVYESNSVLRRILDQNLQTNDLRGRVTLMLRDLGAPELDEPWADVPDAAGSTRVAEPSSFRETIDQLLLKRLDLLKISGEADGPKILDGARDTLWRLRARLFMRARDDGVLVDLAARASDLGYRCWRADTALFNKDNFNRREDDIFAGERALALVGIPEELGADFGFDGCVEL